MNLPGPIARWNVERPPRLRVERAIPWWAHVAGKVGVRAFPGLFWYGSVFMGRLYMPGGYVYAVSSDEALVLGQNEHVAIHAYDRETGELLWTREPEEPVGAEIKLKQSPAPPPMPELRVQEGWGWPDRCAKAHYFRGGTSLCTRYTFRGDLETGNNDSPDNCKTCRQRLARRQRQRRPGATP